MISPLYSNFPIARSYDQQGDYLRPQVPHAPYTAHRFLRKLQCCCQDRLASIHGCVAHFHKPHLPIIRFAVIGISAVFLLLFFRVFVPLSRLTE